MRRIVKFLLLLTLVGVSPIMHAAAQQPPVDFVKSFYIALDQAESVSSIGRVTKLKNFFDTTLYQLLEKDDVIRAANEEPIVCGFLRFDAFDNDRRNRGIANHFALVPNSNPVLVSVAFLDNEGPAIFVQLQPDKNSWLITDFLYPDPDPKVNGKKSLLERLRKAQAEVCKKTVNPSD